VYYVDSNTNLPAVVHVIPKGNKVSDVTSLGDDVFVDLSTEN